MQECEVCVGISTRGHLTCVHVISGDLLVMVISSTYTHSCLGTNSPEFQL